MKKIILGVGALFIYILSMGISYPHELPENRMSLVVRDGRVVNLTLYLNIGNSLHQAIAPQMPWKQFIAIRSAMSDGELDYELKKFIANVQSNTILMGEGSSILTLSSWTWPEFKVLQTHLRRLAMETVITNASHPHEEPIQVTAQSLSKQNIAELSIKLPNEIKPVTVVAYEPQQFRLGVRDSVAKFVLKN